MDYKGGTTVVNPFVSLTRKFGWIKVMDRIWVRVDVSGHLIHTNNLSVLLPCLVQLFNSSAASCVS